MAVYKRSIFLVNKAYQVKFSLLICFIALISSIIYPITLVDMIDSFITLNPMAEESLTKTRTELVSTLFVLQSLIVLIIFFVSIFLTHKVAGPIHKVKITIGKIINGEEIPKNFKFREGDYFHDLASDLEQFFQFLADKKSQDQQTIEEISAYLKNLTLAIPDDKKPILEEAINKLQDLHLKFNSKTED